MSFERITTDRALDEMIAGHEVYQLVPVDWGISIKRWQNGEFVMEEDSQEILNCPPSKPEREKSPKAGTGTKRKTLDWGKIQALHAAGWSHAKIADEVGATASTIATGLSRLRKEAQDGKGQSGEADAGTEEADRRSRSGRS